MFEMLSQWIFHWCHSLESWKNSRLCCPEVRAPRNLKPNTGQVSTKVLELLPSLSLTPSLIVAKSLCPICFLETFPVLQSHRVLVEGDFWCIKTCSICFSNSRETLVLQCLATVFTGPGQSIAHISTWSLKVKFISL